MEAGSLIGGPQVRNQATLGGNVAHALPAADGSIALLAQGAQAEIASLEGSRLVPIQTVYAGPGRSALRSGLDLLVGFQPAAARSRGGGGIPAGDAPARGGAAGVEPGGVAAAGWGEQVEDLRIAIGPAGPVPFRAVETEAVLTGKAV